MSRRTRRRIGQAIEQIKQRGLIRRSPHTYEVTVGDEVYDFPMVNIDELVDCLEANNWNWKRARDEYMREVAR